MNFLNERQVLSVAELVGQAKTTLEKAFRNVWVQGEISNLGRPPSGHLYFTLKDDDAQVSAVCFRMQSRYLKFRPEDGLDVIARGSLTVYPPRGQMQFVVETMEPQGVGALQLAFEQLKSKLQSEGLFDSRHKQPLPLLPAKVGVVTSPSGAAIQDILRVLKRRNNRVDVLIYPTRVQGTEAPREIIAGIRYLNSREDIDVIIVGRGGGSIEDLWAFNDESVARAIFDSRVPVISAVGHEIDYTISDFVADLRAPTPSAAAEIVSGKREELVNTVSTLRRRAFQALRYSLQLKRSRLERLSHSRGFVGAQSRIRTFIQRLDELRTRLQLTLPPVLERQTSRLEVLLRDMQQSMDYRLRLKRQILESQVQQLKAYSPLQVLERGYAIVTTSDDRVVRDPVQVSPDELIQIRVAQGSFKARKEDEDGN
ncbi:MAG: exodeoxyribonuclease VII large subunit [Acidobacteriota bacterium]|nr:MAG: exodeoxyribonuclease VII large subunit [Acidobacteriota bacterium]